MRTGARRPGAGQPKDECHVKFRYLALMSLVLIAGCRRPGDVIEERYGVYKIRSACPVVGIPAGTGDITLFNPAGSTDSRAIDVTAAITDLRSTCQESGDDVISTATFTVTALRREPGPARQVSLVFFDAAVRGGTAVAAKQLGQVIVNFPAGDIHGWTTAQATKTAHSGENANPSMAAATRAVLAARSRPIPRACVSRPEKKLVTK